LGDIPVVAGDVMAGDVMAADDMPVVAGVGEYSGYDY